MSFLGPKGTRSGHRLRLGIVILGCSKVVPKQAPKWFFFRGGRLLLLLDFRVLLFRAAVRRGSHTRTAEAGP